MSSILKHRIIPGLAFILGVATCTSTSLMSISYTLIAILVLFTPNFVYEFKLALYDKWLIASWIFYLLFLIGVAYSVAPINLSLAMLIRLVGFLLMPLFFLAFKCANSGKLFLTGFLLGALLSVILSLCSFVFKTHILYGVKDNTWVVFHGHILHNAFIAIAAAYLLWFTLDKRLPLFTRTGAICLYLISFIDVLFIVNGRTGQIIILFLTVIVIIYHFKLKGIITVIILSIIVVPVLYLSPIVQKGIKDYRSDTFKYENGNSLTSIGLRYEFHQKSLELIKRSPFIGYGTGSFSTVYKNYTGFTGIRATTNPHCDWLWLGVELGIVGVMALAVFLVLSILELFKLSSFYRCGGITLVSAYVLASLQNSFFIDNVTGMTFIFILTALIASGKIEKNAKTFNKGTS